MIVNTLKIKNKLLVIHTPLAAGQHLMLSLCHIYCRIDKKKQLKQRLTYRHHCHSGRLWLADGLAVGFPLRHDALIDARVVDRHLLQLQGEGVSRWTCRQSSASGQILLHHALLVQSANAGEVGRVGGLVLPGDGQLSRDPAHSAGELQTVAFINTYAAGHFQRESALCGKKVERVWRFKI